MAKLKGKNLEVIVKVKIITDISFWNALKLRLVGGKAVKELIDRKIEEMEIEEFPDVPTPHGPIC